MRGQASYHKACLSSTSGSSERFLKSPGSMLEPWGSVSLLTQRAMGKRPPTEACHACARAPALSTQDPTDPGVTACTLTSILFWEALLTS